MAINYTYPLKGSPVEADEFLIIDSVDNSTKKVTASSVLSLTTIPAPAWGTITGTLSTQTDLQSALNLKANLSGATFTGPVTSPDFIGDLNGNVRFTAKAAQALTKGQAVCITGVSGFDTIVDLADADNAAARPAFGLVWASVSINQPVEIVTFGNLEGLNTSAFTEGDTLYISTIAGGLVNVAPTGEAADIQNIGIVIRSQNNNGIIKVIGAGRANATPNLNSAKIFLGNSANQSVATAVTGEVSLSNTGVTAVTGIDGNVSIQGYRPITTVTADSKTLLLSDSGKYIDFEGSFGGSNTKFLTLPSASSIEEFTVGTEIEVVNNSTPSGVGQPQPTLTVRVDLGANPGAINGLSNFVLTNRYSSATLKLISSTSNVAVWHARIVQ